LPTTGAGLGPFLYCDYWASVLNLRGVVSAASLGDGRLNLGHFRRAVDRPRTRLPRLRYYIFAFVFFPVLLPYRVVYDVMRLFRTRAERIHHPVDQVMSRHELALTSAGPGRVRVEASGSVVADPIIDPGLARCEVSLFYPTYKLLIAGLLSLVFSAGVLPYVVPHLARFEALSPLAAHLNIFLYVLVALALLGVLRDLLTAVVAPLPVLAFRQLWELPESLGGLFLVSIGFVVLFFLVEWFLIPRGLPPTLFLYINDPGSRAFPYQSEHAPYWLEGKAYWVWRFVSLVPGELSKFWERDWERVECWVRADGDHAGRLEWVVGDGHYRELWYAYGRLVSETRQAGHEHFLERVREEAGGGGDRRGTVTGPGPAAGGDGGERRPDSGVRSRQVGNGGVAWVLEVDMDPIFHAPYVRTVSLARSEDAGPGRTARRLFRALWGGAQRDRFALVAERLEELEADGTELFLDVPEHLRHLAERQIVTMPWTYWRYPKGARSVARRFVYGAIDESEGERASDPACQIKVGEPRAGSSRRVKGGRSMISRHARPDRRSKSIGPSAREPMGES
jgi:hypothetical protein